ncbi:SDR family NAD(P)-dependent oxidoreductase [Micromonospora sp. HUAS LYJ1]|uniref:SDR family NAD(P)-dependent oxidoreductase n=1 Tax=Micromonospora sp. HUAS LYJ1 TaxID=3061626 RepID=UPI0026713B33|nr:SDR family oxidoreductase [Micromonospora sp. HUAS LYJ1]WKU03529.1 SDR family oxidoreductase [Micromonospora sp. HUAS LYJ1]
MPPTTTPVRPQALIAGGSGGLGGAIGRCLARDGWRVVLGYRSGAGRAQKVADELVDAGHEASTVHLDLSQEASVRAAVAGLDGTLDGVVYAAGPSIPLGHISRQSVERFGSTVTADVVGCYTLVHHAIPRLREARGRIVAVSTLAVRRYVNRDILSAAPKAAVETVIRGVASEEGRFGIRANCVAAGLIEGEGMWKELIERGDYNEAMLEAARNELPMRRFGTPDDIGNAAAFLMSDAAGWITAQTLVVDGGYTA